MKIMDENKRPPAKSFKDLIVWQKAHELVLLVYKFTEGFPQKEIFGLTSQFRRAAISVPANIAEGFIKRSNADKARFLNISQGSIEECRYYLILAKDLNYDDSELIMGKLEEVSRILESFRKVIINS
jgi:four helix bundle protein